MARTKAERELLDRVAEQAMTFLSDLTERYHSQESVRLDNAHVVIGAALGLPASQVLTLLQALVRQKRIRLEQRGQGQVQVYPPLTGAKFKKGQKPNLGRVMRQAERTIARSAQAEEARQPKELTDLEHLQLHHDELHRQFDEVTRELEKARNKVQAADRGREGAESAYSSLERKHNQLKSDLQLVKNNLQIAEGKLEKIPGLQRRIQELEARIAELEGQLAQADLVDDDQVEELRALGYVTGGHHGDNQR